MPFQISALTDAPFHHLFNMTDAELSAQGARRVEADAYPGFPCRVSLEDAQIGETLVLFNYKHLDLNSAYAASHAIYVKEGATQAEPKPGEIPAAIASRLLSVRAFDNEGFMVEADIADGADVALLLEQFLGRTDVAFVDIHNAKRGCFAARAHRV